MSNDNSNLAENLTFYLMTRGGGQKALAADLDVDAATISRLVNGKSPRSRVLDKVADLAGVSRDDFLKPNSEFRKLFAGQARGSAFEIPFRKERIRVQFNCTDKYRYLWLEFIKRHQGDYTMYHPLTRKHGFVGASLLRIDKLAKGRGVEFSLLNPAYTEDDRLIVYEYDGLAFPVNDYFYLFAEQKNATYEILSMIVNQAPEPIPDILEGRMLGIGVRHGSKMVVGKPVVLKFKPGG